MTFGLGTLGASFGRGGLVGGLLSGAPVNTVAPVLSGTPTEGQTLSCTTGTWTGNATITYAYQWYRANDDGAGHVLTDGSGNPLGDPISSATASTRVLAAGDVGFFIFCKVTATNSVGSAVAYSNVTVTQIAAAVVPATTWNGSDKTSNLTLSNSNRTASYNTTGNAIAHVRSVAAMGASQLVYVEFVVGSVAHAFCFGFETLAASTGAFSTNFSSPSLGFGINTAGQFVCVDSADNTNNPIASLAAGNRVGIAFNKLTGRAWFRKNGGTWNPNYATGDPAAGTGGIVIPSISGLYAFCGMDADTSDAITANFASTDWADAAPSGFTQIAA